MGRYRRMLFGASAAVVVLALVLGFVMLDASDSGAYLLGTGAAGVAGPDSAVTLAEEPAARELSGGEASYYGNELAGNPTASGERFDPNALTAAHRTLPFGSRVRVTNLRNDQSVVVRINDRGPFARNRVIDLSARAAREIDRLDAGRGRVRLELLHQ